MLRGDPTCASDKLLLAAGILSAPQHAERRSAQRRTWLSYPNVGRSAPICPLFVVRSGGLERGHWQRQKLQRESGRSGDLLLTPRVAHNESRVRGPVLSLAVWLEYAAQHFSHAAYIAKVDDDTHLHTPDLERLLRLGQRELGATANTMVGVLTFYSWIPDQFKARAHGWSFGQAQKGKRSCESNLDAAVVRVDGCVGPFTFPAGYFFALSSSLVAEIVSAGGARADADRLQRTHAARREAGTDGIGGAGGLVLEDVWLGSVLYRWPPKAPMNYISLVGKASGLYVDSWDFRLKRSAMVNHVRTQTRRFLCLHDLLSRPGYHCSLPFQLECHDRWCRVNTDQAAAAEGPDCCSSLSVASVSATWKNESLFPRNRASCDSSFGSNQWPLDRRYGEATLGLRVRVLTPPRYLG